MRRLALLALAAALLVPAGSALGSEQHPTLPELEGEIMCPTCKTTLDQSSSPIATRIKAYIAARIAAGDTKSQIKAKLVDQFGEAVLADPPRKGFDLVAWWLPIVAIVGGAVAVGALVWRWSRGRDDRPQPAVAGAGGLDPETERRLDDELARFDA